MPLGTARTLPPAQVRQSLMKAKKNMINSTWELGAYDTITGTKSGASTSSMRTTNKFNVNPNTTYMITHDSVNGYWSNIRVFYYDTTGAYLSFEQVPNHPYIVTTPAAAVAAAVRLLRSAGNIVDSDLNTKVQMEPGSVVTPFEPYQAVPDLKPAARALQAAR